jgi:hypothetical protein
MAHFAKLDENNTVLEVHVVNNEVITVDGVETEQAGVDFLTGLFGHSLWKQTSYNASFRKNYAGIGFVFDDVRDAFIQQQPYPSWILDEETCRWEAPTPRPTDGITVWNEETTSWDYIEIEESNGDSQPLV